jgi:hypothetical protein
MNYARLEHESSILRNGQVLVTGGRGQGLNTTELYNPQTRKFNQGPNMNLPHYCHKQYTLKSGQVVIVDLNGIEIYDPKTDEFSLFEDKLIYRDDKYNNETLHKFLGVDYQLMDNDNVLVTGGINTMHNGKTVMKTVEIVDTAKRQIYKINDMQKPRAFHSTIKTKNGNIYIIGGIDAGINGNYSYTNDIIKFDSGNNNFSLVGKLNYPVSKPYLYEYKDNILIFANQREKGKENIPMFQEFSLKNKTTLTKNMDINTENDIIARGYFDDIIRLNDEIFIFIQYEPVKYGGTIAGSANYINLFNVENNTLKIHKGVSISKGANNLLLPDDELLMTGGLRHTLIHKLFAGLGLTSTDIWCYGNTKVCPFNMASKFGYVYSKNKKKGWL